MLQRMMRSAESLLVIRWLALLLLFHSRSHTLWRTAGPASPNLLRIGRNGSRPCRPHRKGGERSIEKGDMAGCVVLIGRRAGIVFEHAYGNRSIEPEKVPMTTDTVFDMASLTKPFATATSVMILVERGKLKLSDKVADFFPEFAAHGKEDVTVEQLLAHTSGPDSRQSAEGLRRRVGSRPAPKICDLKPLSPPGTAFKYSDVNFILLGKIVEKVAGKPVNEFAKEEIYSKLGMAETGYLPSARIAETRRDHRKDRRPVAQGRSARSARGENGRRRRSRGTVQHGGGHGRLRTNDAAARRVRRRRVLSADTVAEMTAAATSAGQQARPRLGHAAAVSPATAASR